jgi:putative ABC transport system substrate-binding protein
MVWLGASAVATTLLDGCGQFGIGGPSGKQSRQTTIGFLSPAADDPSDPLWTALHAYGWDRDRNLDVMYYQGNPQTFGNLATKVLSGDPALIVTQGEAATQAAEDVTHTIPIVMRYVPDPVAAGLVVSLARPGRNVTGVSSLSPELDTKKLELLHQVAPSLSRVAMMWHHGISGTAREFTNVERAAGTQGIALHSVEVGASSEVAAGLETIAPGLTEGLILGAAAAYADETTRMIEFTVRNKIPTVYPWLFAVRAGGLMSYGPADDGNGSLAAQVNKILRGANPAEIPVEQPTTFDFAVNAKTVQAFGLTIPSDVAAQVTQWFQ